MSESPAADPPVTLTARQRARADVTAEILRAARAQLAVAGAAGLSLRAVARDLGMPSSGIYRYFATRDELLTRLIVEAYDSVGAAAEDSQRSLPADELPARFAAACRAIRAWALAHPHEYALVFGSPVPSYQAPAETVPAAARAPAVLGAVLSAATRVNPQRARGPALTPAGRRAIAPAMDLLGHEIPAGRVQAGLMVWAGIFGVISFELYGHLYGSVGDAPADREAFFDSCIARWAAEAGI